MTKNIEISIDSNGCHNCISHKKDKDGYTILCFNKKRIKHHRYVYSKHYLNGNPIPDGLVVRHKCDNPTCVNPEHLEIGTLYDNAMDRVKRNRQPFGEKNGRAKLSEKSVIDIFNSKEQVSFIAKKYSISDITVRKIKNGSLWKYITKQLV